MGMRRLAIIDLATGHQPIGNEDGTVQVVFNGEILQLPGAARELEAKGHVFRNRIRHRGDRPSLRGGGP
jgi:asparagine synthase (glutamine-hydrolysing)